MIAARTTEDAPAVAAVPRALRRVDIGLMITIAEAVSDPGQALDFAALLQATCLGEQGPHGRAVDPVASDPDVIDGPDRVERARFELPHVVVVEKQVAHTAAAAAERAGLALADGELCAIRPC